MAIRTIILFLLLLSTAFARNDYYNWTEGKDTFIKAQVIVLEAPVFEKPDLKSRVVKRYRKGQVIRIHPKTKRVEGHFYGLVDNLGRIVYIPKDFLHVLYHDKRELQEHELAYDPTDYRISEPLPKSFPFYNDGKNFRSNILGGLGTQIKKTYNYDQRIAKEGYGQKIEFGYAYLYSPEFDPHNRFYIGVSALMRRARNKFELVNGNTSEEVWFKVGVGPYMMYDLYRYQQKYTFGISGGFLYNLINKNTITIKDPAGGSGIRKYSALSFTPHAGLNFQIKNINKADMDLLIGTQVYYDLSRSMKSGEGSGETSYWQQGDSDVVSHRSVFELSLYIGIQFNT